MADKTRKKNRSSSEQIRLVTSGSNIRFEPVDGKRGSRSKKNNLVVNVASEINPVSNFLGFLREHAVVGLVIGFVLGNQVQTLVKQLIQSFLDPLTKLLFGTALSDRSFTLHLHNRSAQFGWGSMAYTLIIFLFVLVTMYLAVKFLNLEALEEKKK